MRNEECSQNGVTFLVKILDSHKLESKYREAMPNYHSFALFIVVLKF